MRRMRGYGGSISFLRRYAERVGPLIMLSFYATAAFQASFPNSNPLYLDSPLFISFLESKRDRSSPLFSTLFLKPMRSASLQRQAISFCSDASALHAPAGLRRYPGGVGGGWCRAPSRCESMRGRFLRYVSGFWPPLCFVWFLLQ
jgi:hypothetical protein